MSIKRSIKSAEARQVLEAIGVFADAGRPDPSLGELAERAVLPEATVVAALDQLKRSGVIGVQRGNPRHHRSDSYAVLCENPGCRKPLDDNRSGAEACSPGCRLVFWRMQQRQSQKSRTESQPRTCDDCARSTPAEAEPAPMLRDLDGKERPEGWESPAMVAEVTAAAARVCDHSATTLDSPAESLWLDAARFSTWLERFVHEPQKRVSEVPSLGDGLSGTVRRWEKGKVTRAHFTTADRVLDQLGSCLSHVPAELWLDSGATSGSEAVGNANQSSTQGTQGRPVKRKASPTGRRARLRESSAWRGEVVA